MSLRYEEIARLRRGLVGGVAVVTFSSDGAFIAVSGIEDVKVYIWRVDDKKLLYTYSVTQSPILSLEWVPGRTDSLLCGTSGGYIAEVAFNSVCYRVP